MNKIILTQHVKERRTKGFLPEESLRVFADYLINENELKSKEDGAYKFRRGGTCAIITKEKDKFIFITLYGPSKWIVDCYDYSGFSCHKQTEERVKLSQERSRHKARCKALGIKNNSSSIKEPQKPLKNLSAKNKELLKRGTFETIKLDKVKSLFLRNKFGHKPQFILQSKFNSYPFIDLLGYDGKHIQTIRVDTWKKLFLS